VFLLEKQLDYFNMDIWILEPPFLKKGMT